MSQFNAGKGVISIVVDKSSLPGQIADAKKDVAGIKDAGGDAAKPLSEASAINIAAMASIIGQVIGLIEKLDVAMRGLSNSDRDFGESMQNIGKAFGAAFTGSGALADRLHQIEQIRLDLLKQAEHQRDDADPIARAIEKAAGDPTYKAQADKINTTAKSIAAADQARYEALEKVKGVQTDISILSEQEALALSPDERAHLRSEQRKLQITLLRAQFETQAEKEKIDQLAALQDAADARRTANEKAAIKQRARDAVQAYRDELQKGFGLGDLGGGADQFAGTDQAIGSISQLLPLIGRNGGR